MFGNLVGWHLLLLLGVGVVTLAVIGGAVFAVLWAVSIGPRRRAALAEARAAAAERETDGLV